MHLVDDEDGPGGVFVERALDHPAEEVFVNARLEEVADLYRLVLQVSTADNAKLVVKGLVHLPRMERCLVRR